MRWKSSLIWVGAGAVALYLVNAKAKAAAKQAGEAINPTDPDNLANRGFNSVYRTVTGSDGTLGTDLADYFNPSPGE